VHEALRSAPHRKIGAETVESKVEQLGQERGKPAGLSGGVG